LCDGVPRLFDGRLIAIGASLLMQHVRAYPAAMTLPAPMKELLRNSYSTYHRLP
jgi:hypothetical protein